MIWIVPSLIGLGALGVLWVVLLKGPEWMNQWPRLRRFAVVMETLGILLAIFLLYGTFEKSLRFQRSPFMFLEDSIWLPLIGSVIVGLRYLPALLRGENRERD